MNGVASDSNTIAVLIWRKLDEKIARSNLWVAKNIIKRINRARRNLGPLELLQPFAACSATQPFHNQRKKPFTVAYALPVALEFRIFREFWHSDYPCKASKL